MEALIEFITHLGWLAILFVIFAESGLLIGFFLPGDSLLFTAGFLVQQGILPINIHLFVALLFVAAVIGDSTGYAFGHKVGRRLFYKKESRFFHRRNLEIAEEFYEKYGPRTIIIARFVPVVRTFAPIVAGISKMNYSQFLTYNLIGGALWTVTFTYLGYFAGDFIQDLGINIEVVALFIVFISVAPPIIHLLKVPENRTRVKQQVKKQAQRVVKRRKKTD